MAIRIKPRNRAAQDVTLINKRAADRKIAALIAKVRQLGNRLTLMEDLVMGIPPQYLYPKSRYRRER